METPNRTTPLPEPWLRGTLSGEDPAVAQVLYSFEQTLEDLERWTSGLTDEQMWAKPHGLASVGFQIRHIGGSVDRLLTYVRGEQLTEQQKSEMQSEGDPGATRLELFGWLGERLGQAASAVRATDRRSFNEPRGVGKKQLPTTVIGLLIHIAEHTQRHTGQAIVTAKLARLQS